MRGCCAVCCRSGVQNCKAGCEEVVSLNYRTSIAHHEDSLLAPGREVLYKRYHTGELVPATILGPSDDRDDFVRLKYSRNWRDYENPSTPLSVL